MDEYVEGSKLECPFCRGTAVNRWILKAPAVPVQKG